MLRFTALPCHPAGHRMNDPTVATTAGAVPPHRLYRRIIEVTGVRQLGLVALALAIAALAAAPLELQKTIVNGLAETMSVEELVRLSAVYAGVVLLVAGLKLALGYGVARTGDYATRYIRRRLLDRDADREPLARGTLVTMLTSEAETIGGFAGTAFALPVVQAGTLLSVLAFITASQPMLGLVALFVVAPQAFIVLAVQRRVTALVRGRVRLIQRASDGLVAGDEAPAGGSRRDFDDVYDVQRRINRLKQGSKFALNALSTLGLVATLALGGWLVLQGSTDVGTVVAALGGLARIAKPWSDLVAFYRQWSVVGARFDMMLARLR